MRDRTADVRERGFTDQVLVCTNARDGEYPACAEAHGRAVYEAVTAWLRERDAFWSPVVVAETSCLGLCSADGTAIAIQPRNRWYSDVRPADVPALLGEEFGDDASTLGVSADDTTEPAETTDGTAEPPGSDEPARGRESDQTHRVETTEAADRTPPTARVDRTRTIERTY